MDITAETALLGIDEAKVSALTTKLSAVTHLSAEEIEFLEGLQITVAEVPANEDFVTEGEDFRSSYVLRSGWAYRYRILSSGRRQKNGTAASSTAPIAPGKTSRSDLQTPIQRYRRHGRTPSAVRYRAVNGGQAG